MLSSMVKKAAEERDKGREIQDRRRQDALVAANQLTQVMVDHLNVGVAQAYLNEKKLDSEMRTLSQGAANFAKQSAQWLSLVESFNGALKELGHVQSWATAIHSDVKTISAALQYVYKVEQEGSGSSAPTTSSGNEKK